MVCTWVAMFLNPALAFSESLKPFFLVLWLSSFFGSGAGIIYLVFSKKELPVITCLLISLASGVLDVYGVFWCFGMGIRAYG